MQGRLINVTDSRIEDLDRQERKQFGSANHTAAITPLSTPNQICYCR